MFSDVSFLKILFLAGPDAHPCHEERAAFAVGVVSSGGRLRLHSTIPIGFLKIYIETKQRRLKSSVLDLVTVSAANFDYTM
jgi:hypothetical protein